MGKSIVLSVRIPEEVKKDIENLGYEPTKFTKQAILDAIRREQSKRALEWIKANMITIEGEVSEIIRHYRDDR
ncbi:MAG: hypothetical protein SVM80_09470 [Halobacteriota archaeon]|nr:hypothetical protein [Halobacteriota archaeon]